MRDVVAGQEQARMIDGSAHPLCTLPDSRAAAAIPAAAGHTTHSLEPVSVVWQTERVRVIAQEAPSKKKRR